MEQVGNYNLLSANMLLLLLMVVVNPLNWFDSIYKQHAIYIMAMASMMLLFHLTILSGLMQDIILCLVCVWRMPFAICVSDCVIDRSFVVGHPPPSAHQHLMALPIGHVQIDLQPRSCSAPRLIWNNLFKCLNVTFLFNGKHQFNRQPMAISQWWLWWLPLYV